MFAVVELKHNNKKYQRRKGSSQTAAIAHKQICYTTAPSCGASHEARVTLGGIRAYSEQ